jgi:DNA-binding FadR family transcriptional regulator
VETILSAVHNQHMLQILEQIKGKYIFRVVSYRKQSAHNTPKPNQAKRASMQICEALERGNLEEAKAAILEINELVFQQLKSFDL